MENLNNVDDSTAVVIPSSDVLYQRIEALERKLAYQVTASPPLETPIYKYSEVTCNPATLGLFAFGFTTFLLQGAVTGILPNGSIVIGFALFYGGLAQLLVGMWEIKRNNMFGCVAFSSYGSFWMSVAVYDILIAMGHIEHDTKSVQMMLGLWGAITVMLFVQTWTLNIALMVLFASLSITFFLLIPAEVNDVAGKVAGAFGMWTAIVAFYIGFAELTNACYKSEIVPLGKLNHHEHHLLHKKTASPV